MSRTLDDLLGALEPTADGTVDPTTFLRENARRRRVRQTRKRTLAVVGTALSVVGLAGVPFALPGGSGTPVGFGEPSGPGTSAATSASTPVEPSPSVPAAPTRTIYTMTLRETTVDSWTIRPWYVDAVYQEARVIDQGASVPKPSGSVHVFEPGGYDPTEVMTGVAVEVQGTTGWFVPEGVKPGSSPAVYEPLLAWEWAPDAWVIVSGFTSATAVVVAEGVEVGEPVAVRMPFTLDSAPPGYPADPDRFTLGGPDDLYPTVFYDGEALVSMHDPLDFAAMRLSVTRTIGGYPAAVNGDTLELQLEGFGLTIHTADEPLAEQLLSDLTFADWNDKSTWFAYGS